MVARGMGTSVGSGAWSEGGGMLSGGWVLEAHSRHALSFLESVTIMCEQWWVWGWALAHGAMAPALALPVDPS